jgi:hypothetical protein
VSLLVGLALALSPIGRDFIYAALLSGEQLSRNIARPILAIAVAIWLCSVAVEWVIRAWLASRSRRLRSRPLN